MADRSGEKHDCHDRGRFLTLEGVEGAGKSTQGKCLAEWLRSLGYSVVLTREPGGSPRAEVLRDLLLAGQVQRFGPGAEALVFALARADHMQETIRPALEKGIWVISDRFIDSTRAYQGASGVSMEELLRLEELAIGDDQPDLTLIFDLSTEEGLRRVDHRPGQRDRFEADDLALHAARRAAFLDIARKEPGRCRVIDSSGDPEDTASQVRRMVAERFDLSDAPPAAERT